MALQASVWTSRVCTPPASCMQVSAQCLQEGAPVHHPSVQSLVSWWLQQRSHLYLCCRRLLPDAEYCGGQHADAGAPAAAEAWCPHLALSSAACIDHFPPSPWKLVKNHLLPHAWYIDNLCAAVLCGREAGGQGNRGGSFHGVCAPGARQHLLVRCACMSLPLVKGS